MPSLPSRGRVSSSRKCSRNTLSSYQTSTSADRLERTSVIDHTLRLRKRDFLPRDSPPVPPLSSRRPSRRACVRLDPRTPALPFPPYERTTNRSRSTKTSSSTLHLQSRLLLRLQQAYRRGVHLTCRYPHPLLNPRIWPSARLPQRDCNLGLSPKLLLGALRSTLACRTQRFC